MSILKDFIAIATIDWYSDSDNETLTDNIVLTNVNSFPEAMNLIAEYYGDTIVSINNFNLFEGPFLKVQNETIFEKIAKEEI